MENKKKKSKPGRPPVEEEEEAEPALVEEEEVTASAKKGKKRKGCDSSTPPPEQITKPAKKKRTGAAENGDNAEEQEVAAPEVDEAEQKRRDLQRKIRELVLRLRGEGKTEEEIRAAKSELKATSGVEAKPTSRKEEKKQAWHDWITSKDGWSKRKEQLQRDHDLVVIPIFWRGRHDKDDVIRAAEDLKACVAQQGLDVWVDARRHYTPGQKFAHWEHRGVMLRIEIGPDDLKAGVCRVCRAFLPGDYQSVERKRVRLPPAGTRRLLLQLKDWGMQQIAVERRPGDSEDEAEENVAPAASETVKAAKSAAVVDDDDVAGNWAPHPSAKSERDGGKRRGKAK